MSAVPFSKCHSGPTFQASFCAQGKPVPNSWAPGPAVCCLSPCEIPPAVVVLQTLEGHFITRGRDACLGTSGLVGEEGGALLESRATCGGGQTVPRGLATSLLGMPKAGRVDVLWNGASFSGDAQKLLPALWLPALGTGRGREMKLPSGITELPCQESKPGRPPAQPPHRETDGPLASCKGCS